MRVYNYRIVPAIGSTEVLPAVFSCLSGEHSRALGQGRAGLPRAESLRAPAGECGSPVSLGLHPPVCPILRELHQSFPDVKLSKMGEETHPAACSQEMPGEVGGGTCPQ